MGETAFLVVSNARVEEVEIIRLEGDFCIVSKGYRGSGMRIRRNRLYKTKQEAESHLPYKKKSTIQHRGFASPYDYEW